MIHGMPSFMLLFTAQAVTADWWATTSERWGIAAVCAFASWILWKKLDSSDKAKMQMHKEALEIQRKNSDVVTKILLEEIKAKQALSENLKALTNELVSRPCQMPSALDQIVAERRCKCTKQQNNENH